MFKVLLQFTFPEASMSEIQEVLSDCHSIHDFQTKVIYKSVQNLLTKSSEGFTTSGFDALISDKPYLYISCLLYTSPSPRDQRGSRMPSSA